MPSSSVFRRSSRVQIPAFAILFLIILFFPGRVPASSSSDADTFQGKASFYGGTFQGRKTASGEIYDINTLTAAHRTLRFGTRVRVKNLRNGREVTVRINNRGPYIKGRVIDLSIRAAQELRMTGAGVVPVEVTIVDESQQTGNKTGSP